MNTGQDEQRAQALAAFAGQVSHDLRNPLAAVRMSLELIREELTDAGNIDLLELLESAERGTQRMNDMIGDLLDYARVDVITEPMEVDLTGVAREVVMELVGDAAAGQVEIGVLPAVRGDEGQLRTLLHHLLDNAIKFSPEGAVVEITGSHRAHDTQVSVADRGPGVPLEERERIFEPLVRLDKTVPGAGIGLATCRRIVAAHGGRIGVDEHAAGGAVVWFELPD